MRLPLNLAARPVRNERLPGAVVLLLGILTLTGTAVHIGEVGRLVGREATALDGEAHALEAALSQAEAELAAAQRNPLPKDRLDRWLEIKGLVDRRAFSWTGVLSSIERTLPADFRVISLTPRMEPDGLALDIVASGRDADSALGLLAAFRQAPEFEGALPTNVAEKDGEANITMTVRFRGGRE